MLIMFMLSFYFSWWVVEQVLLRLFTIIFGFKEYKIHLRNMLEINIEKENNIMGIFLALKQLEVETIS